MLNKKMNQALSAIAEMSVSERELYLALVSDTIEDKDALTSDKETEETEETTYSINHNSKVQKSKKYCPKHISKDKAKHGYHRGSKKGGYGDWDKFGKPEKLNKDRNKDLQAQLTELNLMKSNISIEDGADLLKRLFPWCPSPEFSLKELQSWTASDFTTLDSNIQWVDDLYKEEVKNLWAWKTELYAIADSLFPEMGMRFCNRVVARYEGRVIAQLAEIKDQMIKRLANEYLVYWSAKVNYENARHEAELSRIGSMMSKVDKYLK